MILHPSAVLYTQPVSHSRIRHIQKKTNAYLSLKQNYMRLSYYVLTT